MNAPLDDLYLTWLYEQIGSVRLKTKSRSYWTLARQLLSKEFIWLVPNDDNRVEDGRGLRQEFFESQNIEEDTEWSSLGCSMLEMLIGLSRRLSFEAGGEPRVWFWHLLDTIGLLYCNDASSYSHDEVDEALDTIIWRRYAYDGSGGGLFPLQRAAEDQREVEIWYQLSAYLLEHY